MTNLAIAQESLSRAAIGQSFMNYQAIFEGFTARGIPENEIIPRQNVFTFWAWKAVGRRVKKGEHGVKTTTFVPVDGKEKEEGERKSGYRMARTVTVFHVSQTEPEEGGPPPTINLPRPAVAAPSPRADVVVPTHTATSPAAKLRSWAESMQSKIDHLGRPMTQNPTPKRNREYQSRMHDCRNMERTQKALCALADAHESGTISDALSALKTRDEVSKLVRKYIDGSKGGYYSCIESDDYAEKSSIARELQSMIEGNSSQRAERERIRKIETLEAEIRLSDIPSFFPTPATVVEIMLDRADLQPGMLVLEPSAGSGNIADAIRAHSEGTAVHCIEPVFRLRELLTLKGYTLVGHDLMEATETPIFDRVLMNPPFEKQQDIEHIRKAFAMLKDGGTLVSVLSPSFEFRSDRKSIEFREWLQATDAQIETLPDGSFKASGTSVSTRLLTVHK